MEIEVGEYFRTKQGFIHKVKSVYKDMIWWCDLDWIDEKEILKHSKNIIDLITKGDYINGIKVIQIFYDKKTDMLVLITADRREFYNPEIINSIVTKEQFRNMEYRLRD